jgi:hypothetical protein
MSGEVFTTIKEHAGLISLLLGVVSAVFGAGWVTKGVRGTFALTRKRKLQGLEQWRTRLRRLHDSPRAYYAHLLTGILWGLAVGAAGLGLDGSLGGMLTGPQSLSPAQQQLVHGLRAMLRYGVGLWAFLIALGRLRDYREVQRYESTMAVIERRITKLEAKQAARQPPVTAP